MSERICKGCGQQYRGLVCHKCHPRTKKQREPLDVAGIRARFGTPADVAAAATAISTGDGSGDKGDYPIAEIAG